MKNILTLTALLVLVPVASAQPPYTSRHTLTVSDTRFLLDGEPFPFTGISFFNAIYNPTFSRNSEERMKWLHKFQRYGINAIRIWCQWDGRPAYADVTANSTMYRADGSLREEHLATLKAILADADEAGMVVELTLFAQESWHAGIRLEPAAADRAVAALTRELRPYRHLTFQVWNEFSDRVLDHVKTIRAGDPARLVTNSPGNAGVLGDAEQDAELDYLTPHTTRNNGAHWEIVPREIAYLLARYKKPVVDNEPARNGTRDYGGPQDHTYFYDHILQIYQVWQVGGYVNYHHDMFQTGYGSPEVPPSGIPDPEFNPYHRRVLEFIALRKRYSPTLRLPPKP